MLTDVIKFAILGLGAGAIYGLSALGIVLIYRGSGVLNFTPGAVGMVGAPTCSTFNREAGMPTPVAALLAIGVGRGLGAIPISAVMRPLRNAPPVTGSSAPGVSSRSSSASASTAGHEAGPGGSSTVLPERSWIVLPDIRIGTDRLVILSCRRRAAAVLTIVYRSTRFGWPPPPLPRTAGRVRGRYSPGLIATVNWMLGWC